MATRKSAFLLQDNMDRQTQEMNIKNDRRETRSSSVDMEALSRSATLITEGPKNKDNKVISKFLKNGFESKLVYVLTVSGIVFLSYATLSAPWFIPYMYSIVTPILLILRLIMYWRLKYQYFLLDFCYFANTFIYVYIWAFPTNEKVFIMAYAIATGPLLWSLLVFRNSLVFHSLDKVTSMYIHTLPPILVFVIRWYPDDTAHLWYSQFTHSESSFSVAWLIFLPFAFSVIHQISYGIFVYAIMKPSDDYLHTYNYFVSKEGSVSYRICNVLGSRFQHMVFGSVWEGIILVMLSFNLLWFNYFAGNCAILIFFIVVAVYNGATYYIDVFSHGSNLKEKDKNIPLEKKCNCGEMNSETVKVYGTIVNLSPDSKPSDTKTV